MPPTMPETAAQPIRLTALPTEQAAGFRAAARAVVEQQAPAAGVEQQQPAAATAAAGEGIRIAVPAEGSHQAVLVEPGQTVTLDGEAFREAVYVVQPEGLVVLVEGGGTLLLSGLLPGLEAATPIVIDGLPPVLAGDMAAAPAVQPAAGPAPAHGGGAGFATIGVESIGGLDATGALAGTARDYAAAFGDAAGRPDGRVARCRCRAGRRRARQGGSRRRRRAGWWRGARRRRGPGRWRPGRAGRRRSGAGRQCAAAGRRRPGRHRRGSPPDPAGGRSAAQRRRCRRHGPAHRRGRRCEAWPGGAERRRQHQLHPRCRFQRRGVVPLHGERRRGRQRHRHRPRRRPAAQRRAAGCSRCGGDPGGPGDPHPGVAAAGQRSRRRWRPADHCQRAEGQPRPGDAQWRRHDHLHSRRRFPWAGRLHLHGERRRGRLRYRPGPGRGGAGQRRAGGGRRSADAPTRTGRCGSRRRRCSATIATATATFCISSASRAPAMGRSC